MRLLSLLALLHGCAVKSTDDTSGSADADTDADTDTDTDADTDTMACSPMSSGDDWEWNGQCPQMRTPCDIVVTECSLSIDYEADGGMTMNMPFGATITGDTVTFADDNGVTGCVGTLTDADHVEGTCDSGCSFRLTR